MSTVTTGGMATEETSAGQPTSRRRWVAAVAVALLCAGLGAWWLVTSPRLDGGGFASVSSADHEVVWASAFDEDVFAVTADGPGSTTLAFGLRNDGLLPVELVDVWPSMADPLCYWQPSERLLQDDPRAQYVLDDRARPVAGTVLAPGAYAGVWITGAHPDPEGCVHAGGFNTYDDVEVIARIGGRTSTSVCPWATRSRRANDLPALVQLER